MRGLDEVDGVSVRARDQGHEVPAMRCPEHDPVLRMCLSLQKTVLTLLMCLRPSKRPYYSVFSCLVGKGLPPKNRTVHGTQH